MKTVLRSRERTAFGAWGAAAFYGGQRTSGGKKLLSSLQWLSIFSRHQLAVSSKLGLDGWGLHADSASFSIYRSGDSGGSHFEGSV